MDLMANKNEFIGLIKTYITRDGARVDDLIDKLEKSDFFAAPASTKYHMSVAGGLCQHSLNVYHNLVNLVDEKNFEDKISKESIAIVALLHDLSKMNYYKKDVRNKKVYSEDGSKKDAMGNFDWVAEPIYVTIDAEERFIYGSHEETSEFMIRQFIPLTYIESSAILHHHAGMGYDSAQGNISAVYTRYPLATLLHIADMLASYVDEA